MGGFGVSLFQGIAWSISLSRDGDPRTSVGLEPKSSHSANFSRPQPIAYPLGNAIHRGMSFGQVSFPLSHRQRNGGLLV